MGAIRADGSSGSRGERQRMHSPSRLVLAPLFGGAAGGRCFAAALHISFLRSGDLFFPPPSSAHSSDLIGGRRATPKHTRGRCLDVAAEIHGGDFFCPVPHLSPSFRRLLLPRPTTHLSFSARAFSSSICP
jgi:hypothetical protein